MLNLAKYFVLFLSLIPLSPFLFHNEVQYSMKDIIGLVIMLGTSPVLTLIEGLMLFWHWESKVDLALFALGTLLASTPILMLLGNNFYERSHGM